jgi:hypothetical protein
MTLECQVRICERLGVKFPGPTRQPLPPIELWALNAAGHREGSVQKLVGSRGDCDSSI